jgi:hypothetical protein
MLRPFALAFHIPGTLSADINIRWTAPFDCTLRHLSAVGSNSNSGLIIAGPSTDTDGFLKSASIGDSNTPVEWERGDFDGDEVSGDECRLSDGAIFVITLDHDGDGGTAAQNVTIVAVFEEG